MKDGKTVVDDERWIVAAHGQGQCVVGDWQGATHMHAQQTLHCPLAVWSFVNGMHSHSFTSTTLNHLW